MLSLKKTVFLLLFLAFCACHNQKDTNQTYFPEPPKEKLDSVCTWLGRTNNYLDDTYLSVFKHHFEKQIAQNKLDSAARILDIAYNIMIRNNDLDTTLKQITLDFVAKYEHQIAIRFRSGLYQKLGAFYRLEGNYEKCNFYLKKNNFIPNDYYTALNITKTDEEMMHYFLDKGKYDSSIIYSHRVLEFYEKYENWLGMYGIYSSLSMTYENMENDFMAEKYIHLAVECVKKTKDSMYIYEAMADRVNFFYDTENPFLSSSIDSIEQFEAVWKPKNPIYGFEVQIMKGIKYLDEGKLNDVEKVIKELALMPISQQDDRFYRMYIELISHYEVKNKKPLSHEQYILQALEQSRKDENFYIISGSCDLLSQNAVLKKDNKAALAYYKEQVKADDSLRNNKIRYEATELDKKYQTEKKEAQLKLQAADAFKKNVFIGFLVLGLLAFVYFYGLLKKKNTTISQQNELNEQTISILSHDIKEPLLGVKLLLKKLNKDDPFVAQASQSLESQINAVNGILTNLLKMKKLSLVKKDKNVKANAQTVVQTVVKELSVAIQTKELTIQNDLTEDVLLPIAPEKLQIIVHNLLSNAVKYSFSNQTIRIFKEGKGICIQDFGVGLSPEQRSKLMREVTASQQGTKQERGNGMGLFLVGAMLQGEQIKVVFDSPEMGGTIAKVLG
jgi:two-component sensor histidine kinase